MSMKTALAPLKELRPQLHMVIYSFEAATPELVKGFCRSCRELGAVIVKASTTAESAAFSGDPFFRADIVVSSGVGAVLEAAKRELYRL